MAGLGAGAGAFEGDTERNRLAEQRRQANMQANIQRKRLNLDEEKAEKDDEFHREETQFNQQKQVAEFRADREQKAWDRNRQEKLDAEAAEQKKWDRGKEMWSKRRTEALDVRAQEQQAFNQKRTEKQDVWSEALHGLTLEKHEQEMAERNATLELYRQKAKHEADMLANKQKMAKSHFAGLVMAAMESPNGVAPKEALDFYNEQTGSKFVGFSMLQNRSALVAMDDGKGNIVENYSPQDFIDSVVSYARGDDLRMQPTDTQPQRRPVGGGVDPERASAAVRDYGRLLDAAEKNVPDPDLDPAGYKTAMERVNTLRGKYERLVDAAYGDLLPKDDDKGKLTFSNDAVKALYGMSPAEIKKRANLWASRAKTTPKQALSRLLANESPQVRAAIMSALD